MNPQDRPFKPVTLTIAMLALAAVSARSGSAASDWPQWLGPDVNGVSTETNWQGTFPPEGPTVLWEQQIGAGYAAAAVHDGKLYTAGWKNGQDTIYCLDAETGEGVWTYSYKIGRYNNQHNGGPAATPAVASGRVYMLSREAELFCLQADSGKLLWSKKLKGEFGLNIPSWAFSGSPIVRGDTLFVDVGRIIAMNKTSGAVLWKTRDYGAAYSTPKPFTLDGRRLLSAFPRSGLVVLDASNGRELATHPWETRYGVNAATPIVKGGRIFISSGYGRGCALLEFGGQGLTVLWENKKMRNQMVTCVLVDAHLYGFDEDRLKCIDLASGRPAWSKRGLGKGSLMAGGGKLIVLSEDGELIIADASPDGFEIHGRAKLLDANRCWIMPVLAGGRIYCRSSPGQLVCVDVRAD